MMRILMGIAGVAAAIGLAFLLEMFVDQSVRRPIDLQLKVGAPLFITIPRLRINGHSRVLSAPKRPLLVESSDPGAANSMALTPAKSNGKRPAPWEPGHPLFAFAEALRDRLINWFEVHDLTHSPKLVAVTSCAEGSGVSTIASGLAASLSETGDGNVLLVDMNQRNGSSKQFHKGELAMGIDDALEENTRSHAMVQDKLYVVSENKESGQLAGALPKRFRSLVPKLKASDYDYIIFDMPPVSQISLTPRLAKFMDMVLMVVESEETDKNVVASACGMLTESKANVGIVLNKARNYVPKRLVQRL
jgi:Mrp family chromosome partitioning ATPase